MATADSSAHSLLQIIGDILGLSKIEAARLELSPATVDLRTVVGGCVETFIHTASAKGLLLATWPYSWAATSRWTRRPARARR